MSTDRELFDFQADRGPRWYPINDGVMGGVSVGRAHVAPDGVLKFSGVVSLENGGGFASIRSEALPLNLQGTRAIRLRVKGDGHRYRFSLKLDAAFDSVQYQAVFQPPAGAWSTVELSYSVFAPRFRGRPVPNAPPLDPGRVVALGFLISDRQAGTFVLEVRSISAY